MPGALGGWATGKMERRGAVPEPLKAPVRVVPVRVVRVRVAYWASNPVQHEAGLLSFTLMGVVVGSMKLVEREALQCFKQTPSVVLMPVRFIVIPAQLRASQRALIDWRSVVFVDAVLFLVRPLTLSELAGHSLKAPHLNQLLCATDNDFCIALFCIALVSKGEGRRFGHHRTLQLASHQATDPNLKGLTLQWRGYFAFDAEASDVRLAQLLAEGWTLQSTQFSAWHGWDAFKVRMDETGQDWLLLGGVSASGM